MASQTALYLTHKIPNQTASRPALALAWPGVTTPLLGVAKGHPFVTNYFITGRHLCLCSVSAGITWTDGYHRKRLLFSELSSRLRTHAQKIPGNEPTLCQRVRRWHKVGQHLENPTFPAWAIVLIDKELSPREKSL